MAVTAFGALSAAQKKVWATTISVGGRDNNFWMSNGFMGKNTADMSKPIHRITELTATERGDKAVMQLVAEIDTDGVVGDNELTGNEAQLFNDAIELTIDQIRNGVRSKGKMAEQKTVIRFRSVAKDKLSFWLADVVDEMMFLTVAGRAYTLNTDGSTRSGTSQLPQIAFAADVAAASTNRIIYGGSATSEGSLTANDKMSWAVIVRALAFAKRKRLKPIKAMGKPHYCIVMSTEQMRDLELDPTYQKLTATALPRDKSNPLFTNANKVVQGVVLYDHQKVYNTLGTATKWGSGNAIDGAQAALLGAQALGFAQIGDAEYEEADVNDYHNRPGIAYGRVIGILKPQFKSQFDANTREDFGTVAIKTAAAST